MSYGVHDDEPAAMGARRARQNVVSSQGQRAKI